MSSFDLLDIYEILIQIRFSLDSNESLQLVSLLLEALHSKLGNILHNQNMECKFIRNYILNNTAFKEIKLGTFDDSYCNSNIVLNEANIVFAFWIVIYAVREKITNREYKEAFSLVDKIHNYPINLLVGKRNAIKMLIKTATDILKMEGVVRF